MGSSTNLHLANDQIRGIGPDMHDAAIERMARDCVTFMGELLALGLSHEEAMALTVAWMNNGMPREVVVDEERIKGMQK